MLNVLIISDEAKQLYALFKSAGFFSETVGSNGANPQSPVEGQNFNGYDLAFLDIDSTGWQDRLSELRHQMPVIAFGSPEISKAVESMRLGASDFLQKPLTGEALSGVVERFKKQILTHKYGFDEIMGTSPVMQQIFSIIKKAAASESNVIITGESGTGKELIARAIHRWSPRSEKPFMTINCSAIPDTLLESELFGFEKGAFTGAQYSKKGLLELADGGTVFLDEIGDVSPLFQTKVLRVLQEGEMLRVGGSRHIRVDLRFITATNRDLKKAIAEKIFREDLYYRLNVIHIHLPPLRERMEDVPLLARHFISKHAPKRRDLLIKGISSEALNTLLSYSYPGNVRELENIIERAVSFANSSEIMRSDLPPYLLELPEGPNRSQGQRLREALAAFEKQTITQALIESGGNISRAAASLGIYRQQLQRKIKEYKIAT